MDWQEIAVALVVIGALAFLVRKVVARRTEKPARGFVPLGDVKKKPDAGCH